MYKLSYEKCVCFLFLVILVFLSCSGFHTDRLMTLTDNNSNKKYSFTSSSSTLNSLNKNGVAYDNDELVAQLMDVEMVTITAVRKWYTQGGGGNIGGGMHFAGVPGAGASLTEGVDQQPPHYPPPPPRNHHQHRRRRRRFIARRRKRQQLAADETEQNKNYSISIIHKTTNSDQNKTNATNNNSTTTIQQQQQHHQQQQQQQQKIDDENNKHVTTVQQVTHEEQNHDHIHNVTKLELNKTNNTPRTHFDGNETLENGPTSAVTELNRVRRAAGRNHNNNRDRRRKNERKFCPGQDVGTRAFHAETIIEGRVRSMRNPTNLRNYAVTVEVKKIHRNDSSYRASNITKTIRLHFANGQHKGCDQKLINGLVPAQLVNGKNYIFFLKRYGPHNFTVMSQPVPYDEKKERQILDIINNRKVKAAKIVSPRSSNVTVKDSEQLKLTCVVRGNPPPIVTWYKNGTKIRSKRKRPRIKYMEKKSVLLIPNVTLEDAGYYECKAKGVIGKEVSIFSNVTIQKDDSLNNQEGDQCNPPQKEGYCLNGGTCYFYKSLGEFSCRCSTGYKGQRCENKDVTSQTSTYTRTVYCKLGFSNTFYC